MASEGSFDKTIADGEQVARVWENNTGLSFNDITLTGHKADVDNLKALRQQIKDLKTDLTALVNQGNGLSKKVRKTVTRARSGARAYFGPDSDQYEQMGGTRTSERKPATRKKTANPANPQG